jgi:hypothetical protein
VRFDAWPGQEDQMRVPIFKAAMAVLLMAGISQAQTVRSDPTPGHEGRTMQMPAHQQGGMVAVGPLPTMPGQDAFGAVQEIVRILEADPNTDWSKVNLDALREHLIDMNEVTLHADAAVQRIDGGIRVAVTGSGRTLDAIRRMVPADAQEINGQNGWKARTEALPSGVTLIVSSDDPKQVAIIRGLGFIGVLASGTFHQRHHLMIARGEFHH